MRRTNDYKTYGNCLNWFTRVYINFGPACRGWVKAADNANGFELVKMCRNGGWYTVAERAALIRYIKQTA